MFYLFIFVLAMDRAVEIDRKVQGGKSGMGSAKDLESGFEHGSPEAH